MYVMLFCVSEMSDIFFNKVYAKHYLGLNIFFNALVGLMSDKLQSISVMDLSIVETGES